MVNPVTYMPVHFMQPGESLADANEATIARLVEAHPLPAHEIVQEILTSLGRYLDIIPEELETKTFARICCEAADLSHCPVENVQLVLAHHLHGNV